MVTGRVGQFCACAAVDNASAQAKAAAVLDIALLPFVAVNPR
jgi:hypothetical protein